MPRVDPHSALARLAVDLLAGPGGDLGSGAEAAAQRGLAGLYLFGIADRGASDVGLPPATVEALRQQARREAATDALAEREIGEVLRILGARGYHPVVLKGRLLALELWPRPYHRPPGDLDLLLEREAVGDAVEALKVAGFREASLRRHPGLSNPLLLPPEGRLTVVDLHRRPFERIGSRVDPDDFLRRALPATLAGHPVRSLERADQLLFLLVHASIHGLRRIKWLLDLYAMALRSDGETWRRAAERAGAARCSRPFYASASVLAALPDLSMNPDVLRALTPPRPLRKSLAHLVSLEGAVREEPMVAWEKYASHLLLEESQWARVRRAFLWLHSILLDRP